MKANIRYAQPFRYSPRHTKLVSLHILKRKCIFEKKQDSMRFKSPICPLIKELRKELLKIFNYEVQVRVQ